MKYKFFRPNMIWLGIWLAIFVVMLLIGSWQNDLYWRDSQTKLKNLEFITIQTVLPYAIAYGEKQEQPEILQHIIDADLGPYGLVITDKAGKIKYASRSLSSLKLDDKFLKDRRFLYLNKNPTSPMSMGGPGTNRDDSHAVANPDGEAEVWGRLYLVLKKPLNFPETLNRATGNILTPIDSALAFTLLSYIMVLVGFAAICAITARFQNHFQEVQEKQYESELETRELRIQVLESNIGSADLRLQLLDRSHEKAQARLNEAKNTIFELESAIQYESGRNDELQENLKKAESERNEAVESIQAIDLDRERIAKELKELEAMREVEEMNYPEASKEKARRPKEFLWLNLVYKNLQFSRRALQNLIDLQDSHDILPSLPDALATLNNSSVESVLAGGAFPSRSAVRYTQLLVHHLGELWEYRFSKDGRIFFGLSKSKTWNIDTILLKRKFSLNRHKYEKYLEQTLGKDNDDLKSLE